MHNKYTMVNFIELIISSIAGFAVGGIWYSQAVFGKAWMKEMKINPKDIENADGNEMAFSMILGFLRTIVIAFVLIFFVELLGFKTMQEVLKLAFFIWIGFIATIMLDSVLWERKSKKLYFINVSQYFVAIMVMAAVIVWL